MELLGCVDSDVKKRAMTICIDAIACLGPVEARMHAQLNTSIYEQPEGSFYFFCGSMIRQALRNRIECVVVGSRNAESSVNERRICCIVMLHVVHTTAINPLTYCQDQA